MKKSSYKLQYNIYCDESSVENKQLLNFVIGSLFIPRHKKKKILTDIHKIKNKYNYKREIKWNKITARYEDLYIELINYILKEKDIEFKSIVIDKKKINMNLHNNDTELMFYKFYYQLLRHKFYNDSEYYIYIDYKTRKYKPRFDECQKYLKGFLNQSNTQSNIKHMQEYHSINMELLQLTDLLTGMIAFANNYIEHGTIKKKIVEIFQNKYQINLKEGTSLHSTKFNIFKWQPRV